MFNRKSLFLLFDILKLLRVHVFTIKMLSKIIAFSNIFSVSATSNLATGDVFDIFKSTDFILEFVFNTVRGNVLVDLVFVV